MSSQQYPERSCLGEFIEILRQISPTGHRTSSNAFSWPGSDVPASRCGVASNAADLKGLDVILVN